MSQEFFFGTIILYLLFQNWLNNRFWTQQVQKLTDKIMSRDYQNYQETTNPLPPKIVVQHPDVPDDLTGLPNFTLP